VKITSSSIGTSSPIRNSLKALLLCSSELVVSLGPCGNNSFVIGRATKQASVQNSFLLTAIQPNLIVLADTEAIKIVKFVDDAPGTLFISLLTSIFF
jgi:hypothetical protein